MSGPTVRAASAVSAPVLALAEDLSHDLWRARGLGETCRRTYLQLAQRLRDGAGSGLPVAEVANGTDVGERQARRNLGRLAAAGLARREPDGRWSAEQRDGEELAEDLGEPGGAPSSGSATAPSGSAGGCSGRCAGQGTSRRPGRTRVTDAPIDRIGASRWSLGSRAVR